MTRPRLLETMPDADAEVRFWSHVTRGEPNECWQWGGSMTAGYGRFMFAGKSRRAHRVAWMLSHGPVPDGLFVCHRCDNPSCVNPAHLFLGTNGDNVRDAFRKGRARPNPNHGSANGNAKLTEAIVRAARTLGANGESKHQLAREFGVSRRTIQRVLSREGWAHVV